MCMEHPILLALGGKMMQKSYFQMTLEKAIRQTEKLLQQLKTVQTDYADKRMEAATPIFSLFPWMTLR